MLVMPAVMTGFSKICQEICWCHIFVQISALLTEHKLASIHVAKQEECARNEKTGSAFGHGH